MNGAAESQAADAMRKASEGTSGTNKHIWAERVGEVEGGVGGEEENEGEKGLTGRMAQRREGRLLVVHLLFLGERGEGALASSSTLEER